LWQSLKRLPQYLNSLLQSLNSQLRPKHLLNILVGCGTKKPINGFLIQTTSHPGNNRCD
jgi:hypothetical protein